jgi:acyl carrier protein
MATIEDTVLEILADKVKNPEITLAFDSSLEEAGIDSLAMIEIIFELEDAYDIAIPDPATIEERAAVYRTPGDVVDLVRGLIAAKETGE